MALTAKGWPDLDPRLQDLAHPRARQWTQDGCIVVTD
jgi:hypothetical protein